MIRPTVREWAALVASFVLGMAAGVYALLHV